MEVGHRKGENWQTHHAVLKKKSVDEDGKPVVEATNNTITDYRQYKIDFLDGATVVPTEDKIAENLLYQVDEEGHRQSLLY